ncbi:MAG: hypothetical protein AAFR35_07375 [Pseudomonadota bacterium]
MPDFARILNTFARNDDGAVTVDWVVLTAAIIGLALFVIALVTNSSVTLGDNISEAVTISPLGGG